MLITSGCGPLATEFVAALDLRSRLRVPYTDEGFIPLDGVNKLYEGAPPLVQGYCLYIVTVSLRQAQVRGYGTLVYETATRSIYEGAHSISASMHSYGSPPEVGEVLEAAAQDEASLARVNARAVYHALLLAALVAVLAGLVDAAADTDQLYKTRVEDTINIITAADTEFRALVSRSNLPCCDLRSVAQLPGVFSSLRPAYHVLAKTGRESLIDEDAIQQLRALVETLAPPPAEGADVAADPT
ncbi:hypothetical protein B0H14DRAFT_3452467 [Mycena olivaceomarginata]|nr:hypothetical protein B0H14DRAFT_3452467 [Mycena olivaceomarginata]